jgi:hypothetical protein
MMAMMVKVSTTTHRRAYFRSYRNIAILLVITTAVCVLTFNVSYESQEKLLSQLLAASSTTSSGSSSSSSSTTTTTTTTTESTATADPAQKQPLRQTQQWSQPHQSCSDYDGILLIALGPKLAAAGTIFFQYVINQLLYAEQHNLQPWVYLSSTLQFIYDAKAHDGTVVVMHMEGMVVSWTNESYPGPPVLKDGGAASLQPKQFSFTGDGIWKHYFEAVSDYDPSAAVIDTDRQQCLRQQPLLQMTPQHLKPGFHSECPYAVRSWRYGDLPPHIALPSLTYKEWYWPMRQRGHEMVQKYIRFRPHLVEAAQRANPIATKSCLAMHVRHSDKKAGRRVVSLHEFVPYMNAFQRAGGKDVYVATDSVAVLEELQNATSLTLHSQQDVIRSKDKTAVFKQTDNHHRTNVEVLVDILALSECAFFLHGRSAVSEAVFYLNLNLHHASVDLEDNKRYTATSFEQVVRTKLAGSVSS